MFNPPLADMFATVSCQVAVAIWPKPMPRPRLRDIGSSLPAGFGGQTNLSMWWQPPQPAWTPSHGPGMNPSHGPGMMTAPFSHSMHQHHMIMQPQQPMMNMGFGCPQQGAPRMPRGCSQGSDMDRSSSPPSSRKSRFTDTSTRASSHLDSDDDSLIGGGQHPKKKLRRHESDDDILSTNYRYLGGKHIFGDRIVWPKTQKIKCLMKFDVSEFNPLRLASMDDHVIDELIFITTGCIPTLKLSDLKVSTKGKLRHLLHKEYLRLKQREPNRMKMLAGDYSNLTDICQKLGYPEKFLYTYRGCLEPFENVARASTSTGASDAWTPMILDKGWKEEEEEDESAMKARLIKELQQQEAQIRKETKEELAMHAARASQKQAKKALEQQMKEMLLSQMKEKMKQEEMAKARLSESQLQDDSQLLELSIQSSQEAALLAGLETPSPRPTELPEGSSSSSSSGQLGSGFALSEDEQAALAAHAHACAETQEAL